MRKKVRVASHLVNVDAVLLPVRQTAPYEGLERGGIVSKMLVFVFDNTRLI